MIPSSSSDLSGVAARVREQMVEVERLLSKRDPAQVTWRPDEASWSLVGHVAHMAIVHGPYLDSIHLALEGARARSAPMSDGPWKHSLISRWFVRQNEPPPKRRIRTFKAMVPDPGTTREAALTDFRSTHERLLAAIEDAHGLDLGRIRFGSPFFGLLRLSAGAAVGLLVAHTDRHIWLMHEVNRMRTGG